MITDFLQKIFGNKSDRDLKEIKPFVDKVKAVYDDIAALDHNGLRAKTHEFRQRIADNIADNTSRIAEIKNQLESEEDIDVKEALYEEMDKLEEDSKKKTEDLLNELLPEAFAVVKETARRFSENEVIEVSATDFDRELAPRLDAVSVEGDKAIWKNRWMETNPRKGVYRIALDYQSPLEGTCFCRWLQMHCFVANRIHRQNAVRHPHSASELAWPQGTKTQACCFHARWYWFRWQYQMGQTCCSYQYLATEVLP